MIILQEAQEISDLTRNYTSKLKNMNLHLKEILAKKVRLELEIKTLKKQIKKKQESYERNLKVKLHFESTETEVNPNDLQILRENPSLVEPLQEFDRQFLIYQEILEDYQEE